MPALVHQLTEASEKWDLPTQMQPFVFMLDHVLADVAPHPRSRGQ